jgi:hypothetical protein
MHQFTVVYFWQIIALTLVCFKLNKYILSY